MSQLIQFEGCTVAVIAPEDLEKLESELAAARASKKRIKDALNAAEMALLELSPCAHKECKQEQKRIHEYALKIVTEVNAELSSAPAERQPSSAPAEQPAAPKRHFLRGRTYICQNCGRNEDDHLRTDEGSFCPEQPAKPVCRWKRAGDYKFKAACKGSTFRIRQDHDKDLGVCPDCGLQIEIEGER